MGGGGGECGDRVKLCKLFRRANVFFAPGMGRVSPN